MEIETADQPNELMPAGRGPWFPGHVIGGVALIVGPTLWALGLTLRWWARSAAEFSPALRKHFDEQPFAAPAELAAYASEPALVTAGYALFVAGGLVMWPAVATLAQIVAPRSPRLAQWGGVLLILGLFARLYHAGVDYTAFQLTEVQGLAAATDAVMTEYVDISYGPWNIPVIAAAGQYVGGLLLAIGAYRSGTFGLGRSLLLVYWATLWAGVLKSSDVFEGPSAATLCFACLPLGVQILRGQQPRDMREGNRPASMRGRYLRWLSW
ncbi:hypothetical protein [Micromonospora endophytica]|uniref:Uncharacterized protein n=1 Tax=Micromonospora endophytica TaxID=515350 RepID=A0A2W2D4T0_9ACTN|nr:hypothetical protein [Micromonospora endophytica]PZF98668.1 hypothetical protein C1I93_08290 [Micromonospora endophytica]RIW45188.1 hypothetical protein D3H59_15425 [Micromonospora endophytica]BCJ59611.1 hypothetical protein Jiend_30330 [Micromonospora endophytica]